MGEAKFFYLLNLIVILNQKLKNNMASSRSSRDRTKAAEKPADAAEKKKKRTKSGSGSSSSSDSSKGSRSSSSSSSSGSSRSGKAKGEAKGEAKGAKAAKDKEAKKETIKKEPAKAKSKSPSPKRRKRTPSPPPRPTKIHVGKLTRNVNEEHIKEIFSVYGTIKSCDMPKDNIHRHLYKGFCYLEFETADEADKAMKHMDGGQIDGQEISCAPILAPIAKKSRVAGRSPHAAAGAVVVMVAGHLLVM